MNKPIQLTIEKTKENIIEFINEECKKNKIDYYFLYGILKEIFEEVNILKNEELKEMENELSKGDNKNVLC